MSIALKRMDPHVIWGADRNDALSQQAVPSLFLLLLSREFWAILNVRIKKCASYGGAQLTPSSEGAPRKSYRTEFSHMSLLYLGVTAKLRRYRCHWSVPMINSVFRMFRPLKQHPVDEQFYTRLLRLWRKGPR